MFRFSRQSKAVAQEKERLSAAAETIRDRRKISGERVACQCEFTLPSPDPFMHCKVHTRGLMVLNVRGCSLYPEQVLSNADTQKSFPEARVITIKNMILTGMDDEVFNLANLSIRRVRLVSDEHGDGIVLRFVNLSEEQLDTLVGITSRYSPQG